MYFLKSNKFVDKYTHFIIVIINGGLKHDLFLVANILMMISVDRGVY